jgi:hypothetical protein
MGKPTKGPRLTSKASSKGDSVDGSLVNTTSQLLTQTPHKGPIQRTKDEKRQARHDAFLQSMFLFASP